MANNYLEFSEVIENLTPEEIDWWENKAKSVGGYSDEDTTCCDFDIKKKERRVWFHADEYGDVEAVATMVHAFLGKFRINDCFSLTWASRCQNPRIGEFGGGAMFVTAHEVKFHNAYQWVFEQKKEWDEDYGV